MRLISVLVVAAALFGCSDEQSQCAINSDCSPGEVCTSGQCVVECREARDCPSGFVCNGGRCEQVFGGNCATSAECFNGASCVGGVCQPGDVTPDNNTDQVQPDLVDTSNPDTPDVTPDTPDATPDTPLDATPDMIPDLIPDMTPDMPPEMDMDMADMDMSCTPRSGQYGDVCECAAQCVTGLCVGHPITGVGTCTQTCVSRSQCRGGQDACVLAGPMTRVCAPDDTGTECAPTGASNPTLCVYQTCVESAGASATPNAFCALPCTSAAECGGSETCAPVRCRDLTGQNQLQCLTTLAVLLSPQKETLLTTYPLDNRVCTPIGQPNACAANGDEVSCVSAICCAPPDCSAALCTGQCLDPIDCPAGTCIAVDTSDPRLPIGACVF